MYKSRLEEKVAAVIGKNVKYETDKLKYTVEHTYNPDFTLAPGIYIEGKGLFKSADRAKHLYIRRQHPDVKIYFVFGNSGNKLNRASKTSYADWCDKHGYEYCEITEFNRTKLKEWCTLKGDPHKENSN